MPGLTKCILVGWVMGVEPTTPGTTIRCSAIELHPPQGISLFVLFRTLNGTPEGIRTPDPQLRRLLLYPAELLAHLPLPEKSAIGTIKKLVAAQGFEPRTCGL